MRTGRRVLATNVKEVFSVNNLVYVLFGVLVTVAGCCVLEDRSAGHINTAFVPVFRGCEDSYKEFYKKYEPNIDYRVERFSEYLKGPAVPAVLILQSAKFPRDYLRLYPNPNVVKCMPNTYTEGSIESTFDQLFLDLHRAKEAGSQIIQIDINESAYVVRYRSSG